MKEKQYDAARHNEKAPAAGMAAVDTHNPEDDPIPAEKEDLKSENDNREKVNNKDNDRQ